jgi:hypothetical protein
MGFEYVYELSEIANLDSLPAQIPLTSAPDSEALRQEIAARVAVPPAEVVLKGGMFTVGKLPSDPGRSATTIHTTGSFYRLDRGENQSIRARVCGGNVGGEALLKTDEELPPEGAVILVGGLVRNQKVAIAYRFVIVDSVVFESDPIAPQSAFREDLKNHMGPDPYTVSIGEMATPCQ